MTELFGKIPSFKVKVGLFFSFGRIDRGQRVKYHTELTNSVKYTNRTKDDNI